MDVEYGTGKRELTGQLVDGQPLRQSFIAESGQLFGIAVMFANYQRRNLGTIIVELLDPSGRVAITTIDVSGIQDNAYHEIPLEAKLVRGTRYELLLYAQRCQAGSAVTAKYGPRTHEGNFFIGPRVQGNGELSCVFHYDGICMDAVFPLEGVPGLVGVVIPHYNCHSLLTKCLVSLSKQTYGTMEVVVVDDGSPDVDAVRLIVDTFQDVLPALNLVVMESNGGAPAARNRGAESMCGEYLLFLDADVVLAPTAFESYVGALLDNPGAAYSYCGFRWGEDTVKVKPFSLEELRRHNYVSTMSMMRRSLFPGFDETLKRHQDWDLWLTMAENGHYGVCTGKYLFETPRREGAISCDDNIGIKESMAIVKAKHGLV